MKLSSPARRCLFAACLTVLVGTVMGSCSPGDGGRAAFRSVRLDSAGVEIVLDSTAAAEIPVFATLDAEPGLRLGALDGRPEEQFGSVSDVVPLGDGGVAVLDGQAALIRIFDRTGAYRTTLGSKGDGPGEMQGPVEIALMTGDTIAVYDRRLRRISRFGLDGGVGSTATLEGGGPQTVAASFLPDGRLLGQSRWVAPEGGPLPGGSDFTFVRDTAVLTLFAPDGSARDTIDVVPGTETLTRIEIGAQAISVFRRIPAFGRTNLFAVHPEGIWSSSNDRFELRLYGTETGNLVRVIRAPGLERPISDELADSVHERALSEVDDADERRTTETWFDLSPRPRTQPAYDALVVDDGGRLWARAWTYADPGARWWVFSPAGELLGSVDAPNGMTILAVRCAQAWGVEKDEFDVGYVVRYGVHGLDPC